MVRVMDKVVDEQNTFAGSRLVLPPESRRCRIEVTLRKESLHATGIKRLEDIPKYKFAKLQGLHFQFKLATVADRSSGPAAAYKERERVRKFLATGISGLAKMDQAALKLSADTRRKVRGELFRRGKHLPSATRTGSGAHGTAIAYEQLCKKVQTALSNLSRGLKEHEI